MSLLYREEWHAMLRRGTLKFRPYIALSREPHKRVVADPTEGLSVVDGESRAHHRPRVRVDARRGGRPGA